VGTGDGAGVAGAAGVDDIILAKLEQQQQKHKNSTNIPKRAIGFCFA
jgi:hypothetical protein